MTIQAFGLWGGLASSYVHVVAVILMAVTGGIIVVGQLVYTEKPTESYREAVVRCRR